MQTCKYKIELLFHVILIFHMSLLELFSVVCLLYNIWNHIKFPYYFIFLLLVRYFSNVNKQKQLFNNFY